MANLSSPELIFDKGCPDPGRREVKLPPPLPSVGDDFDWQQRDYDGFRRFMQSELMARFPERTRWTPADMEIVLVEVLAALLDQLSDMADRVAAESFLETARQPESVLRWLEFIGGKPAQKRHFGDDRKKLLKHWRNHPHDMEHDRRNGPHEIHTQERMVSLEDYSRRLKEHPLVHRAEAWQQWNGAWPTVNVTVSLWNNRLLDEPIDGEKQPLTSIQRKTVNEFHKRHGLLEPFYQNDLLEPRWKTNLSGRDILRLYISDYRMTSQEVILRDARQVGIDLGFCLHIGRNYFRSEVRREALRVLGSGPDGFFEPGRLRFGQDLHQGDFYERLMALDGVTNVEIFTFKRTGEEKPNHKDAGWIPIGDLELAVCDNDLSKRERGFIRLELQGGLSG